MTAALATTELTADAARHLTEQIRVRLDFLLPLIKQAFEGRADRALGYDSWQAYCTAELGDVRVPLGDRPAMIAELRQSGMSQRAIGAALGVSQSTVRDDLAELSTSTQFPERIVSTDGKERPAERPQSPEPVEAPVPAGSGPTSPAPEPVPSGDLRAQVLAVLRPDEDDAWGLDEICERLPGHGEPGQARPGEVRMVLADLVEAGLAAVGADVGGPYWWATKVAGSGAPSPERIAAVAEVAPEFVKPVEAERAAAMVAAALDKFVPDPDAPKRAWAKKLYELAGPVHNFLLWLKPEDAAAHADDQDITTLKHLADGFADAYRRAVEARKANVTPLRRIK